MDARAFNAGTKLLSADVFVHPSDHAWNAKMWEMLDSVRMSPFFQAALWRQLLIPSLTNIDPGYVVCNEKHKVADQLVRRRLRVTGRPLSASNRVIGCFCFVFVNPFVDCVFGTIFNPTEHNGETQAKKFYPLVGG
jgi:hypothetical protein